jgi:hypothetical protein
MNSNLPWLIIAYFLNIFLRTRRRAARHYSKLKMRKSGPVYEKNRTQKPYTLCLSTYNAHPRKCVTSTHTSPKPLAKKAQDQGTKHKDRVTTGARHLENMTKILGWHTSTCSPPKRLKKSTGGLQDPTGLEGSIIEKPAPKYIAPLRPLLRVAANINSSCRLGTPRESRQCL